mgnify:CR=1 FL=1
MVLWSYGTGNSGVGEGELAGPHMAEENPFNPGEIVVGEQFGSDTLLIDRNTGRLKVLYGERGVAGTGDHLSESDSAHFLIAGPYKGHVLITEHKGEHRVMIIHRTSGKILWHYTGLEAPLDAIYWDDYHIMASDSPNGVFKIRLSDKVKVWGYDTQPHANPFYLHRISRDDNASYGGDLLIGYYGVGSNAGLVREIDTASEKTVWKYGSRGDGPESKGEQGYGDLYDRLYTPVRAIRYGMDENGGGLTIICCERSRILCVNRDKELVWELGGASGQSRRTATQHVVSPTYVHVTRRGTLLITDWGLNMVYEISPFDIPPRREKDGYLFRDYVTTDKFVDSGIMESRGYAAKNIQVYNTHKSNDVRWCILGSHNTKDWQVIHAPTEILKHGRGAHCVITAPWNYIQAQAKSASCGSAAKVDVYITMQRE